MDNQINLFTIQDMYDQQDKQVAVDNSKVYDPLHFWEDYGDKYYRDHKKPADFSRYVPWLLSRLKPLNIETLYDAGCGFCRLEPFLLQGGVVKKITAADISQKQLDAAKVYLEGRPELENIEMIKQTIKWSKIPQNTYDCTMSIDCMQHLHLPTVRSAMKQLCDISKKYVVIIERFLYDGEHPYPHVWSHNYSKLASDLGLKVLENTFIGNGIVGIVCKK